MEHCTWTPGPHLAVITRNGVIVLEKPADGLGTQFWTLLEQGVDLGSLLQALTSACGTNLAALPNFVAIVPEADTMHIAVRGAFELSLDTQEGTSSFTSGNVITWEEKRVQQLNGWRINAPVSDADFSLPQPTELIAASAVIPVSTLGYGSLAGIAGGSPASSEPVLPQQTLSPTAPDPSSPSTTPTPIQEAGPISLTASTTDDVALAAQNSVPVVVNAPVSPNEMSSPEAPDAQKYDGDRHEPTPEAISLPEVSAEERAGYTLTDENVDLTRAYPDEEEAEDDEDLTEAGAHMSSVQESHPIPVAPQQDFSDLFLEHTRARSVEEAAVRQVRNDDNPYATPLNETSVPSTEVSAPSPSEGVPSRESVTEGTPPSPLAAVGYVPPTPPTPPAPPEPDTPRQPSGFFIDEVPRANSAQAAPMPSSTDNVPTPNAAASDEGFHDGQTVRSNKMAFLREQAQAMAHTPPPPPSDGQAPLVVACLCVHGHPNPTHVQVCRTCEGAMTEQTVNIPRPPLGTLHVSTGEVITLDRDVVIGRRPSYTPQPGRPHAHVVLVPSPNQEISRTHCEIKIDGWDVRIRDLGSNNGTFLLRPGQSPVRVTDSAPMILRPGDILDLGDAVTVRMEA